MPTYTYQGLCNHVLYGPGCLVDPVAHRFTGTVTATSGLTITVPGAGASGIKFKSGYCKPTTITDYRMITAQSGDVLTLLMPFASSPLGATLELFAGCDHNVSGDCKNVFNNVDRFGGFNWVPNKNIFNTGVA